MREELNPFCFLVAFLRGFFALEGSLEAWVITFCGFLGVSFRVRLGVLSLQKTDTIAKIFFLHSTYCFSG